MKRETGKTNVKNEGEVFERVELTYHQSFWLSILRGIVSAFVGNE